MYFGGVFNFHFEFFRNLHPGPGEDPRRRGGGPARRRGAGRAPRAAEQEVRGGPRERSAKIKLKI